MLVGVLMIIIEMGHYANGVLKLSADPLQHIILIPLCRQ